MIVVVVVVVIAITTTVTSSTTAFVLVLVTLSLNDFALADGVVAAMDRTWSIGVVITSSIVVVPVLSTFLLVVIVELAVASFLMDFIVLTFINVTEFFVVLDLGSNGVESDVRLLLTFTPRL